jgi:Flp pilus assembly pilin Flp
MIEYALMAGAVAVVVAGFLPVQVIPVISGIFSRILSVTAMIR